MERGYGFVEPDTDPLNDSPKVPEFSREFEYFWSVFPHTDPGNCASIEAKERCYTLFQGAIGACSFGQVMLELGMDAAFHALCGIEAFETAYEWLENYSEEDENV